MCGLSRTRSGRSHGFEPNPPVPLEPNPPLPRSDPGSSSTSSTVGLAWLQHFGPHVIVTPSVRYYEQSAARFYIYNLDDSPVIPTKLPFGQGPYYTSDFRLSAQEDFTYGLKVTWKPKDWFQIDAAYDHLAMRGTDGLTPQSAYPTAGITTLGVKFLW